jgi:NTP pyrophosphatase (non-canonical NTP hydrolase)
MTFDDYQRLALVDARDQGSELIQRVLGLAGECGEIADRVKRWYRDDQADLARLDKKVLAAELGDALWYVAALADYLGFTLEQVAEGNIKNRAERHARSRP